MPLNIVNAIKRFNAGRDPQRLAMKYEKLRASPSQFLRGTCHLFYSGLPRARVLVRSPLAWISGDLHFDNYGSYKGADRMACFDVTDFDEGLLAPVTLELVRLLTSILVARKALELKKGGAVRLCEAVLAGYAQALQSGKAGWIDRDTADGPVRDLLTTLKQRKKAQFLDSRTTRKGPVRIIRCDGEHALQASPAQKKRVTALIDSYAGGTGRPESFRVLDVARRIAGTGSLGVDRFLVLVEGDGGPVGNDLLDLKLAPRSSLAGLVKARQPHWPSQAHRVVALHQRMQAVAPALLCHVGSGKASYVLRELQPGEDRMALADKGVSAADRQAALRQMAQVAAWAHLRSSGRQGSAIADDLIAFGAARGKWKGELIATATLCAERVDRDWRAYCDAYDDGAF